MATNEEILTPKVLIIPTCTSAPYAPVGSIAISGGRLYYVSGAAGLWTKVQGVI